MATHVETFIYNDWRVTRSGNDVSSGGTASKLSALFPINKVLGVISLSATGGYGWCSAYDESYVERGDSLAVTLTAQAYLVDENNNRLAIPGAACSGSASRGGYLNQFNHATTGSASFDTANITEQQKQQYKYIQIGYSCVTSKSSAHVHQEGAFNNGETGNPSGTVSFTVRDSINISFDGDMMSDLFYKAPAGSAFDQISALYYDGTQIF